MLATGVTLFADSEVLRELTELGGGAWVNVPMFGVITLAFSYLADRWARPTAIPRNEVGADRIDPVTVP